MPHPLQSRLDEYQIAINNLASSVPSEIKERAQSLHDELLADVDASEEAVLAAVVETGLAEYPYRHAFQELTEGAEERKRVELVLDHVDESVRARLKQHLDAGVPLDDVISSGLFQTAFTPEERYQVEDAVLDARDHVKEELAAAFTADAPAYQKSLKKWETYRDQIAEKIDELEAMASTDAKWKEEILGKVKRFREGFAVTERDVELEEVEKEIEYWKGVFGEEI